MKDGAAGHDGEGDRMDPSLEVEVKPSEIEGLGLFARRTFAAGERLKAPSKGSP